MDEAEARELGGAFARRECIKELRAAIRLGRERNGDQADLRDFETLAAYWSGFTSPADDVDPENAVG